jgi:predicted signal transduction protein with EAL and GGDEF domain
VIAEGVETTEHLNFLTQRTCDEGQGYYFSRPVAAAGFGEAVHAIHRMFDERGRLRPAGELPGSRGLDSGSPMDAKAGMGITKFPHGKIAIM